MDLNQFLFKPLGPGTGTLVIKSTNFIIRFCISSLNPLYVIFVLGSIWKRKKVLVISFCSGGILMFKMPLKSGSGQLSSLPAVKISKHHRSTKYSAKDK